MQGARARPPQPIAQAGVLRWYSAHCGWVAIAAGTSQIAVRVSRVEDGWDVWVFDLYSGTYLTETMARGAAGGLYRIALEGSTMQRWAYPGHG